MRLPLLCLLAGALAGRLLHSPALFEAAGRLLPLILSAVAFLAGVDAGQNREVLRRLSRYRWRVLALPLATVAGSVGAGVLAGLPLGIPPGEAASVSAGFAYYSLSAAILGELGGPVLGTLALVANAVRELLAILLVPLLCRRIPPAAAMSISGATSMDTTLAVIHACAGEEAVVLAVVHGVVLTALVPVLVPLLYRLL